MSNIINIVDFEKASTGNDPIISLCKRAYQIPYTLDEMDDDHLITKRILLESVFVARVYDVPVITAGTPSPYFIDASLYDGADKNTDVIPKATSYNQTTGAATGRLQRWNDIGVEDMDTAGDGTGDFTGWNIYGHTDDSGNFKEDTYITLKL